MSVGTMILLMAAARFWSNNIGGLLAFALAIALIAVITGLLISYSHGLPSGPAIIAVAGGIYIALNAVVIFLWIRNEFPGGLATRRPGAHFLRASFGALVLFTSFAAIAGLSMSEAILIARLPPILLAIAAAVLLSERLTVWRAGGLGLGFTGVVVLV